MDYKEKGGIPSFLITVLHEQHEKLENPVFYISFIINTVTLHLCFTRIMSHH